MATGTGKTVVMSMLIAWQVINKVVYPQDKRFSKYVLIITPGITVKNRLSVLKPEDPENYYDQFGIIPVTLRDRFNQGMIKVTNWHTLAWDEGDIADRWRSARPCVLRTFHRRSLIVLHELRGIGSYTL